MSVLINGIELPEKVQVLEIHSDGKVFTRKGYLVGEAVELPDKHGDLIDGDALKETLDYYIREAGWSEEINKALGWVKDEFINSEPTVIEAEDGT